MLSTLHPRSTSYVRQELLGAQTSDGPLRFDRTSEHCQAMPMPSLPVLPLNVTSNVHEEGDGKQEGLHDVGHVEEAASIHLGPLWVIEVELQVAIEADAKEEHGEEGKLVRTERLTG